MPELPEVEYTARQLAASVVGATIREALVFWERTIGYPALADFQAEIRGRKIEAVRRRGKFVLIDLSGELFISVHRRMTGNFLLLAPGWQIDTSLRERDRAAWNMRGPDFLPGTEEERAFLQEMRYCRVCFVLEDGRALLFTDLRKFGRIKLWPRAQEAQAFEELGPEPLSSDFTPEVLQHALTRRRNTIKQLLLDQSVVAGVGNIYADEALFYAGIHPLRRSESLSAQEVESLHQGIVSVLRLGIEHGGTSFSNYRGLWGEVGDNFSHVRVYQQVGKPCARCGTPIERLTIAQRSAHFCPTCQVSNVE